jgi:hypothetical protein
MPAVGFEPTMAVDERPQTYALKRATTGTGQQLTYCVHPQTSLSGESLKTAEQRDELRFADYLVHRNFNRNKQR